MNVKEIRAKISSLLVEQQKIALAGFTTDSRTKFDKIQKDVEQLEADAQRMEAMEARAADANSFVRSPRPTGGSHSGTHSADEQRDRINRGFAAYARTGQIPQEYRDLLTTSDATGGALVPQLFSGILVDALKWYGPVAQYVAKKVTDDNGAPMKVSFDNDTASGIVLLGTQGTSSPAETDPVLASVLLGTDSVTGGLVKVSFQELQDSYFDLDAFLRDKFSIRYARGVERAITLGLDSASTTLPNQSTGGLLGATQVGTTTASVAAGIGWDDLVNTFGAIDPSYSIPGKATWMFNSSTRAYLLGLKDGFGRPYFTPDPSLDNPFGKLLGYDVVLNQSMPGPTSNVFTANSTPILFGDLSKSYLLRTDGQPSVLRLNERYSDTLEVGFYMWSRIGGLYLGQSGVNPILSLRIAAS